MRNRNPLAPGECFGRLMVLEQAPTPPNSRARYYLCQCECGTMRTVRGDRLRSGKTQSCGCLRAATRDRFVERFWSKVEKADDGCWLWRGGTLSNDYPYVNERGVGKLRCNRVAWELTYGPIPEGLFVCHTCDVPRCVNPAHLFLGTALDNVQDAIRKGRWPRNHPPPLRVDPGVVRARYAAGETQDAIAADLGISQRSVWRIVRYKNHWA